MNKSIRNGLTVFFFLAKLANYTNYVSSSDNEYMRNMNPHTFNGIVVYHHFNKAHKFLDSLYEDQTKKKKKKKSADRSPDTDSLHGFIIFVVWA